MKYLIVMYVDPTVLEHLAEEQQQLIGSGHTALMAATKESGEFISTQALGDPSLSKVIRGSSEQPEVTDGPIVEAKGFLGGFCLVDVEKEARAIELAMQVPDVRISGLAVEIRPVEFSDLGDQ